ncbi:hypothetical protein OSB04_003359 [Centaurea solstitialis]|uniref:Uncharacterized protein n=1 Tax=Centaurea solstitialis TaxID=347529 RepID=A0AA38U266_9ASTR|nr:hypothetical protein OSB04_003359 [Centaurea solstitialis]
MARRRLRNGDRFGFVKFKMVHLANKVGNSNHIKAFPSAFNRSQVSGGVKKERLSYAEVLKKSKPVEVRQEEERPKVDFKTDEDQVILGRWEAEEGELEYLRLCVLGKVDKLEHFESIQALIKAIPLEDSEAKLIGGWNIMIRFGSPELLKKVVDNPVHGIL